MVNCKSKGHGDTNLKTEVVLLYTLPCIMTEDSLMVHYYLAKVVRTYIHLDPPHHGIIIHTHGLIISMSVGCSHLSARIYVSNGSS
jgi:hypothetical protein